MKVFTIINPENISNIYFITDDEQKYGVIIDPGSFNNTVYGEIKKIGAEIKKIIITHNDPDKIKGILLMKKIYNLDIYAHTSTVYDQTTIKVKNNDEIIEGSIRGRVLETPVRCYDSISLQFGNALFVGDIMQAGGLGVIKKRGLPSNLEINVIKKHFINLPDNIIIYPEMGPATTIEIEKKYNPYFKRILNEF